MTRKLTSRAAFRAGLGLAALSLSGGGALAQTGDPITNPRGMMANFDAANLGPVLTELGIVWQERQTVDGQRFIAASIGGQVSFNIVPAACLGANNTACVGATMLAIYSGAPANQQTVSAFNQKYSFSSAGVLPDSSGAYITRYEISDYGIPRGNVASSVYSFVALATRFESEITTGRTVSLDGFAEDMSASYLNGQSGEAIGASSAPVERTLAAMHQQVFEATPKLIRTMMDADNAPRNKITNVTK